MSNYRDDQLAYGDFHSQADDAGGERGFVGDLGRLLRRKSEAEQSHITPPAQPPLDDSQSSSQFLGQSGSYSSYSTRPSGMSSFFEKVGEGLHDLTQKITGHAEPEQSTQAQVSAATAETVQEGADKYASHRFRSFAPQRSDNDIKWFVDGCGYMWAVSIALERARESIWILDWWLSPELYLRRPPAKNQQYRIDRMLQSAAERGVKVNIIVYKEVTQALTLSSAHTKHHLESLHPNIAVFRHPDHVLDSKTVAQDFIDEFKNFSLSAKSAAGLPIDALKAIYGANEDTVLYWAHHEKLCLIDGTTAFMGGLDLCYGRWDTNQHFIADVHPGDLDQIVFPGQDYNNARIMDFQDVANWQNNKLDREESSRMGWSDVALCISGPVVADLQEHFTQRWNYLFHEKYRIREDARYSRLSVKKVPTEGRERSDDDDLAYGDQESGGFRKRMTDLSVGAGERIGHMGERFGHHPHRQNQYEQYPGTVDEPDQAGTGSAAVQLSRSCAKWSHGVAVEHSIQNAYIETIQNSEHFVYIENQFFITATGDEQEPIKNKIGAAIVERVLRAARNGEKWKMIVMIPSVPAFPGDLRSDDALSTRAIMEFQYKSINRGHGKSIYETIAKEGINPMEYIRFYNLRNYDRINVSGALSDAENRGGVSYADARDEHDRENAGHYQERGDGYGDDYDGQGRSQGDNEDRYGRYQRGADQISGHKGLGGGRWDTVANCYMLGGEDIRNAPWDGPNDEIDYFVSEELYIHSKLLIADDRVVICGSANLNDRSQLGDHDSEIAVIIEDPTPLNSVMDGQSWRASKFAGSLRRQLMRKHLGLLKPQDYTSPDENFQPIGVPNVYDFGSEEDEFVADPISEDFLNSWNSTAKTNTDAFGEVFHCVPYDGVRTWDQYDDYYEKYFKEDQKEKEEKDEAEKHGKEGEGRRYKRGHVITENFAPGEEGARQVKEILSRVKGTVVEMPLLFLKDEDIAKEGLSLNAFTEEVYT